ncbi:MULTISPECIES: PotD/PotF family extracellular solute-binding protein [unclassified Mycolicibacterium]|uniref:ABC transporter substrate-binding protein n=1 Tax=unclassified Mycolicibacterium TaxID=2636767 RepID=UPI0012DC2C90|nr:MULTISPECIES: extracellular solute-binding protein [unclassified Mycolicibacterium]MUL84382.1 extracellular solute-binding protein [Mycolicibacterium sp. CBMA 329]MUL88157.1 extracellular solute-binding protein [Mycolicibacterium sp. CBMA 331]MUM02454.1 extracellular solute-binding protein [Mycolicibacterium sp. CBMA 334]MUM25997.1 extracellular solute-binding protein [Mycolicibacterium sp. CBMA 295]MUM39804.1 extracellular solute-binding protein [Mycolicibacterium sp. CBMA 247]
MNTLRPHTGLSRRTFLGGTAAAAAMIGLSACGNSTSTPTAKTANSIEPDGDLNMFGYSEYISPDVISGFEKEYGVSVKQTYFSTPDEMIAKVAAKQPFDITFAPSERIHRMVQSGLLQQVDHDVLTHYDEVLPSFHIPPYNPGDDEANKLIAPYVGMPYATGAVGLAWRTDKVTRMSGSFNDLWNQSEANGHTYLWDDMLMTMQTALVRLGHRPADAGEKELTEAAESIAAIRGDMGGFSGADTQMIENGQAWITPVYAGDMFVVLNTIANPDRWKFQTNKESMLFNADNLVVPTAAQHPGTAMAFIDWMLAPENMRRGVEFNGYPVPTRTGMATFHSLTEKYPWLAFDETLFEQQDQWVTPIAPKDFPMWQQAWTKAKNG